MYRVSCPARLRELPFLSQDQDDSTSAGIAPVPVPARRGGHGVAPAVAQRTAFLHQLDGMVTDAASQHAAGAAAGAAAAAAAPVIDRKGQVNPLIAVRNSVAVDTSLPSPMSQMSTDSGQADRLVRLRNLINMAGYVSASQPALQWSIGVVLTPSSCCSTDAGGQAAAR